MTLLCRSHRERSHHGDSKRDLGGRTARPSTDVSAPLKLTRREALWRSSMTRRSDMAIDTSKRFRTARSLSDRTMAPNPTRLYAINPTKSSTR